MATERIPILRLGDNLLVTIQVDLTDGMANALQSDLLAELEARPAKGVLLDISSLEILDSYLGRVLGHTAGMVRLLGARAVITGMQPAVAITLVELGIPLDDVDTALDVDFGAALLCAGDGDLADAEAKDGEDRAGSPEVRR